MGWLRKLRRALRVVTELGEIARVAERLADQTPLAPGAAAAEQELASRLALAAELRRRIDALREGL